MEEFVDGVSSAVEDEAIFMKRRGTGGWFSRFSIGAVSYGAAGLRRYRGHGAACDDPNVLKGTS